jgi:O-antigen/teichoic acid export membrane protein
MRPALSRNVAASVLNAAAAVSISLVTVPLILDAVGTAGYGVWTLGLALVLYASILETGFGPAVQRFTAFARGGGDVAALGRLGWTTLALYAGGGVVLGGVLALLAPPLVDLFDLPPRLHADAESMFRVLGGALALALLAAGMGNLLMGVERFGTLAMSGAAGALAFLAGVIALAEPEGLPGIAIAACIGQAVTLLIRTVALRGVAFAGRPSLLSRAELRRFVSFSARLQATVLSELINWQSDKLVVGLVAPVATVGQLGIGSQFADGGRVLSGAALSPIQSSFALAAGAGDDVGLQRRFAELHRLWVLGVLGAGVIGAASLLPLIEAWLGTGFDEAAFLGVFLVLGSAAGLSTGTGVAYMRAIGQPGLEARMGPLIVATNLVFTVPLAFAAGARGVVIGTFGAYVLGASWFFSRLQRRVPASPVRGTRDAAVAVAAALLAGGASLGFGLAAVALLPGRLALPVVALGVALALLGYAAAVLDVRPTPAALRRAFGATSAPPARRAPG